MGPHEHKICQYNFEYCDLGCKLLSGYMSPDKINSWQREVPNFSRRCRPCTVHTHTFLLPSPLLHWMQIFKSQSTFCLLHTDISYLVLAAEPQAINLLSNKHVPFSWDSPEPKQVLHCAYPSWDPLRVTCSLCTKPFLPAAATAAVTGILFPSVSAVTLAVEAGWETSLLLCVFLKAVW